MSGSETDIQWFIARDGKQHGPVSDLELKKLIELAHLKPTDLVWRQGFSDWRTAASVFPSIAEPPRPATAAPAPSAPTGAPKSPSPAAHPGPGPGPGGQPQLAAAAAGQGPATRAAQRPQAPGFTPYAPGPGPQPAGPEGWRAGPGPSLGDARPEPATGTHPLGSPPRAGAGQPPGGPRLTTEGRRAGAGGTAPFGQRDEAPRRRKAPLVAAGLLVMTGIGAWLGSQYSDEIFALMDSRNGEATETAAANLLPQTGGEGPPAASLTEDARLTPTAAAPTPDEIDRTLQSRTMWVSVKQEFPDWYQTRVAEVARLRGEARDETEITRYLVTELVQLRRENAKYALAASTSRHRQLAAAFLANLKELAREGGDGCYDFISRGESSAVIVTRMQDPARSTEIEAQIVAIVAAIAEGRREPSQHTAPVKTDYDLLAGELGRLGWTQADMQLFANPKELAQAPRERVCSMLQDWFTAHLSIQDPSSQERLLFETLKPVVSG